MTITSTGNSLPSARIASSSSGCPPTRAHAGPQVARQARAVRLAQPRRDDQRRQLAPDHLRRGVAERALGGAVDLDHAALVVHRDDAVEGGVEDRALARVRRAHRLLRPAALDELRDLRAQALHRRQQVGVGLERRGGGEGHHADAAQRERERALHAPPAGRSPMPRAPARHRRPRPRATSRRSAARHRARRAATARRRSSATRRSPPAAPDRPRSRPRPRPARARPRARCGAGQPRRDGRAVARSRQASHVTVSR